MTSAPTAFSDLLSAAGYRFSVRRLPRVSFTVQQVNVPGVTLESPTLGTPFVQMPFAGDHLEYGELRLTYLVDEQLANYREMHDWMRALGKPESFDEYARVRMEPGTGVASDCLLVVLDAKRNPKLTVTYRDAVPTSLSDLSFDATLQGQQYIPVTLTLRYTEFSIDVAG